MVLILEQISSVKYNFFTRDLHDMIHQPYSYLEYRKVRKGHAVMTQPSPYFKHCYRSTNMSDQTIISRWL